MFIFESAPIDKDLLAKLQEQAKRNGGALGPTNLTEAVLSLVERFIDAREIMTEHTRAIIKTRSMIADVGTDGKPLRQLTSVDHSSYTIHKSHTMDSEGVCHGCGAHWNDETFSVRVCPENTGWRNG